MSTPCRGGVDPRPREGVNLWRFIDSGPGPGPWNLALDEAIFESVRTGASPPTLRLYRWSAPTLSIGYAQDRDRDVDHDACRERGIEVIRRVTGGRAVLHAAELTYSVAAPAGLSGFGAGLDAAYRRVSTGLVAGLRLLGLPAALPDPGTRDPSRPPRSAACFATTARHEVAVAGRKLIGSAQRREAGAFLQHGSILIESHAGLLDQVLRRDPEVEREGMNPAPTAITGIAGVADDTTCMAGLADLLGFRPAFETVVDAIVDGCADAWDVSFRPGAISPAEARSARALAASRYLSEDWNAGRRRCVDMRPRGSYHAPKQAD